jgi:hypothetical protein
VRQTCYSVTLHYSVTHSSQEDEEEEEEEEEKGEFIQARDETHC